MKLKFLIWSVLTIVLISCGEDDIPAGGGQLYLGAVQMDVDGQRQTIDYFEIDMPADSDQLTLTVYVPGLPLRLGSVVPTDSKEYFNVELLDPGTDNDRPYETIETVKGGKQYKTKWYRHHVKISALPTAAAGMEFKFYIAGFMFNDRIHSYFTVRYKPN